MTPTIDTMHHLDSAIRQHRTAQTTVTLAQQGAPLAHQTVQIKQTRHKFLFGSTWGHHILALINDELEGEALELAERHDAYFQDLFNQVTLPFYWARFEPERGKPDTEALLKIARWYRAQGYVTKGHPLCWHTLAPDWLLPLSNAEILEAQLGRIQRDVSDFRGVIDMWDVVNEAVIMPIYDRYDNGITRICRRGLERIGLVKTMFEATRAANPNTVLLLNDFDMSEAFDILIEGCLAAGVQIDVIGLQSHMHQGYWGVEKTLRVLDRFDRFGLPIHFTETTLVSGDLMPPEIVDLNDFQPDEWPSTPEGEARQVEDVLTHYTTLLANPQVEAITWWGLIDGGWLNSPGGLLRRDYTPKPAYEELLKRVKGEWWLPPTSITTDADGQFAFVGFLGEYELTLDGQSVALTVDTAGEHAVSVDLDRE